METTKLTRSIAMLLAVAACAQVEPNPVQIDQPDSCNASKYQSLVGQDATVLERILILDEVRLIRPDSMVTMDYREDRINFGITADNLIYQVTCG